MRNLKLTIEYDGTNFSGWQYQPDKRTVQGEIERALKKITNEEVRIIGAGRTDQGVHALGQVANFKTESRIKPEALKDGINSLLGDEIYVKGIEEVPLDFHARFSARAKVYQYNIILHPSPLKQRYYWYVKYSLDVNRMQEAITFFLGEHDFRCLSVSEGTEHLDESSENSIGTCCKVFDLSLTSANFEIIIKIKADRFLRRMARGIVGVMIDIGRGRFSKDIVGEIFVDRIKGLYFAPPQGLCLVEVIY